NLNSEPIVQHPLEAIRDFLISGIQTLFIDDFVIEHKPSCDPSLIEALDASRFVAVYDAQLRDRAPLILKHNAWTDRHRRQTEYLKKVLNWLGIESREITPAELERMLSANEISLDLVGVAPLLDEAVLSGLPASFLDRIRLLVLDQQMFLAPTTVKEFLA